MTMPRDFQALPPDYQEVLRQAQTHYQIQITPLQELRGGQTGAQLHLVSISQTGSRGVEHAVLELDYVNPKARAGEMELHERAVRLMPNDFARRHIPAFPFEPVKSGETSAIFYAMAGQAMSWEQAVAFQADLAAGW